MRLYLSSYRLGDKTDSLLKMIGVNKKVAVIANACDFREDNLRKERLEREFSDLRSLGLEPTEIDLRDYFATKFQASSLSGYGFVWVRGGNAFNLLRAIRQSGFDKTIIEILKEDKLVYGGYSAGICVLSPSLNGIQLCDNPNDIPEGYPEEVIWKGLNVIPYSVAPHYKSDHPESQMIDDVVAYFEQHSIPYKTLRDGETIIVENA